MPLENMIRKNVSYCSPTDSVEQVARVMKEDDVGAVLIVEHGVPKGIITDRDVVLRCVSEKLNPADIKAEKIMSRKVETVRVDQGIFDVARTMKEARVRRVAVVDASENAVGLLSFDDVFDLVGEELSCLKEAVQPRKPKIMSSVA